MLTNLNDTDDNWLVAVIMVMVTLMDMLLDRATLEKIVEYTEHNIKVLSKVEPGLTLT